MTNQFRKELQKNYRRLYDTAQHIRCLRDNNDYAERILVETGLKYIGARQMSEHLDESNNLQSYKDIFCIAPEPSTMLILEGEPGYGKSTLALQLANDWCYSTEGSYLNDVEILILLHLRQCHGVSSIYSAIKKFVLPKHTGLTEGDIKSILQHSESVVIIFDGFDELSDEDAEENSDILKIIAGKIFKGFRIVLTTTSSCLPRNYPSSAKRVKLTGFDDSARGNYITKALLGDDSKSGRTILEHLRKNPVLDDICRVPFLFVQFAHMAQDNPLIRKEQSVTSLFDLVIKNTINDASSIQNDHSNLEKIAFESLNRKQQILVWKKNELLQKLGEKYYEKCINSGILIENEGLGTEDGHSGTSVNFDETEVQFYHKLFQEWYAAHCLVKCLQENPSANLKEILQHLDPLKNQYLYRFTCGLSPKFAGKIIEYLQKIEDDENFVILCIFERSNDAENIMGPIRQLCTEGINISGHDNSLQQRMAVNILDIAKQNKIPIKGVHLQNCVRSVDLSQPAIITLSGMPITSEVPIKNLSVTLTNRNFEDQEVENILEFTAQCQSLRRLVSGSCLPPYSFKIWSFYSEMKSRNVKVGWRLFDDYPFYILNFNSGRWQSEDDGVELTKDDYEEMYMKRVDASKMWTEEYNINMAKADRQYLRKVAARHGK